MEVVHPERGTGLSLFRSFLCLDDPSCATQNGLTSVGKRRFLGTHGEGILERVVSPRRFLLGFLEVAWRVCVCRRHHQCRRLAYANHLLRGQERKQQKLPWLEENSENSPWK